MITIITLTDHLHYTHFRAGNVLATAVRKTLSPNHPLRRLLSVFTFGTIFVNLQVKRTCRSVDRSILALRRGKEGPVKSSSKQLLRRPLEHHFGVGMAGKNIHVVLGSPAGLHHREDVDGFLALLGYIVGLVRHRNEVQHVWPSSLCLFSINNYDIGGGISGG